MNENELKKALEQWFKSNDSNKRNFWNQNKVAKLLKTELKKIKHWRNSPPKPKKPIYLNPIDDPDDWSPRGMGRKE